MDDLDHHLLRLDGSEDILSHRRDLHLVAEVFRYPVADICVEQSPADVFQSLGYVDFGDLAFSLEYLE